MGEVVTIYHTDITLPDEPPREEIEDWGFPDNPKEQYWRKKPLPNIFGTLVRDINGNFDLTPEQEEYATRELDRIKNGFWCMINGKATWIPGRYYYYLQYWTLENKKAPEYRSTSRRYHLYLWYWYNVYWCLGIIRGKGRRSGASSESSSNVVCHVTTNKNARGGHVSKTSNDARKMFIYRMQFGFRHLPFFLQPTIANDKDSKTELVFNIPLQKSKKHQKAQLIDEVEGLNSLLDYQPTATNSYDSERLTWFFGDEGGKFSTEVPFSQFISIILETLVEGSERVGFAELPSTVNELTKKGGAEFKKVWDGATWVKDNDNDEEEIFDVEEEATANRLVRYFTPAYDGLAGFIDKYGESIINEPTPEQEEYLIARYGEKKYKGQLRYGAKKYLEKRRSKLKGDELEEEIRKYPFNEIEMFMSANSDCAFNSVKLYNQKQKLEEHPPAYRKMIFYRNDDTSISIRDINTGEKNFHWVFTYYLPKEKANKHRYVDRLKTPDNIRDGCITVDSYSNTQGGRKYGSKACAWVGRRYDSLDPYNTGRVVGCLYGRPPEKDQLHAQVMMAAEYFGYEAFYEHTADDYYTYFRDRGKLKYLGLYPISLIDPLKREDAERHRGTPITPFSLTKQLDNGISYVENHSEWIDFPDLIDNMLIFDPYDRTKYDMVVSWLQNITILMEMPPPPPPPRKSPIIDVYENGRLVSKAA